MKFLETGEDDDYIGFLKILLFTWKDFLN